MKPLLFLASTVFVVSCHLGAADKSETPAKVPPPEDRDYQDVVYFGPSQPILLRLRVTVDGRPLSAVWDDFVTKLFRHLDANGDGFLDRNEALRLPPPGVLFGGANGPDGSPAPVFRDLDADGDGRVTRDELAAYLRRAGYGPFQVAGGNNAAPYQVFLGGNRLLVDLVDSVALDDLRGYIGGAGGDNSDALNEALFKLLDTNGDGKLTKAKLLAAPAVLLKRDHNEDEMITPDEITQTNPGPVVLNETVIALDYSVALSQNNAGPFRLVSRGESSLELARALQSQYAPKDGRGLTREHLGLDAATFDRLDVDGNGRLDLEELSRFGRRPPDLELKIDLGKKPSVELVKHGTAAEKLVRPGPDGALVLDLGTARLDLKGLVAEKTDTAEVAKQLRERYVAEFKAADRDNNGYLDMSEGMRSPFFRNTFKQMDRDGDGMLYEKEMLAFLDDFLELQALGQASCASVSMASEGKGLFELIDTDGDGRLSVREMRNAVKLLAEFDRAGKGFLTRADIPRCAVAAFRLGPAAPSGGQVLNGRVLTLLYPDDGLGSGGPEPSKPGRGPEWFRKMDRNGDGDVSRREFLGTDEQFRAIDTDGDGLISVEEAEAYEKKVRQKK
jgi:Ca2+-binding EF-hand superfamily protein